LNRKEFIKSSIVFTAGLPILGCVSQHKNYSIGSTTSWNSGAVAHILPTANHNRILFKVSFKRIVQDPVIDIGHRQISGIKTDGVGMFWSFDCVSLLPSTEYDVKLLEGKKLLCDSWPIKTFPHPTDSPDHLKVLVYTCAGGHPLSRDLFGDVYGESREKFILRRRALLEKALSFNPDAIIAIGDQLYWDLDEILPGIPGEGSSELAYQEAGKFDESLPLLNSPNEGVLKKAVNPQIAELYGTLCRSVPVFMLSDDHDYFENDNAMPTKVTFPPDHFNLKLARTTQSMYWPEFLPDPNRPLGLSASGAYDKPNGTSEIYGTLRYGRLAEFLMYDCRRFTTLHGPVAAFVAPDAEQWIIDRTADLTIKHTINIPSLPIGWSAGKWMEWYPDKRNQEGQLSTEGDKYFWQSGWKTQHDRLLQGISNVKNKKPIFLQGDLHTFAGGKIYKSGTLDLEKNPIEAFIMGPLGSSAFPSAVRGLKAEAPKGIGMEEYFENVEETGFSIVDITEDQVHIKMYKFLSERDQLSDIPNLDPFASLLI
jgi:hypothetical protein